MEGVVDIRRAEMQSNIAAIVVTYNRSSLLRECIEALKCSSIAVDIVVVNNASTDNTEEMLRSEIENKTIVYYNTGKNLGGAGGFYFGMKKAYELGYEYLWLMDDDTIVCENSLGTLFDAGKKLHNNFGFLSSIALWTDGTECKMNQHTIADDWNDSKKLIQEGIVPVRAATFVSFLVRRETVKKVGYPIKEYFIWGDDTEYSQRISVKHKIPSFLVTDSVVVHKMKENQWTNKFTEIEDKQRVDRMYYSIRNDICTYKRLNSKVFVKFILFMILTFGEVLFKKNKYKFRKLSVILKASIAGLFFFPKIESVEQ